MVIQFKDFSYYYKVKKQLTPALQHVSLDVRRNAYRTS